jgi:predicted nucleotidyltransferase component of viral defense system
MAVPERGELMECLKDETHERLMRAIVESVNDTPLVLKGGTVLLLAYGLDRFSEDLDFDSPDQL